MYVFMYVNNFLRDSHGFGKINKFHSLSLYYSIENEGWLVFLDFQTSLSTTVILPNDFIVKHTNSIRYDNLSL